jgi:thiol-disulfide isomerase/thioredoxin
VDQFKKEWAALFEIQATREDVERVRAHALDGLEIGALTPKQVGLLFRENMIHGEETTRIIVARMTEFKDDPTSAGATARLLRLFFLGGVVDEDSRPDPELQEELLGEALAHEALSNAIRSGEASFVIGVLDALAKKSVWRAHADNIYALADDLLHCNDPRIAFDFESYFGILGYINDEDAAEDAETRRQAIRAGLVRYGRDVLARAKSGEIEVDERSIEFLDGSLARLDSSPARGTFIGSAAPRLDFIWSNAETLPSLAALKGKVVILDFWATWCGPCVATIPNVRELQARYEGYSVKIIGVTSIQGAHYGGDGAVDCKDDPDKEMALMAEYIGQKDITWTIAFAKQKVYNPDYGVDGIPHLTIIAPDGTVRFNNLHPGDPLPEKAAKVDALLEEFGLAAPAPLQMEADSTDG